MNKRYGFFQILLTVICLFALSTLATAGEDEEENYRHALAKFQANPNVAAKLGKAYGYVLFPTIGKGGLGVGGAHGSGRVYKAGTLTGTTKMTQITIGFQAGGQAFSQLILLQDKRAYESFTSGEFEFGAQATAVAITASAGAGAGTTGNTAGASAKANAGKQAADYVNGMMVFTYAKGGLMYEATLGGQKFSFEPLK